MLRGRERYKLSIKPFLLLLAFLLFWAYTCRGLFDLASGRSRPNPTPTLVMYGTPRPTRGIRLGCFEDVINQWISITTCKPLTPTPTAVGDRGRGK